jgi:hypothetical protein
MNGLAYRLFLFFVGILAALPGYGQTVPSHFMRQKTSLVEGNFQLWHFKDASTFTQFAFPLTVIYPVRDGLSLDLTTSPALNTYSGSHLNGLSDTRIRGSYVFADNHALFTFGLNTPTGKNRLSTGEMELSTILALNALHFRTPILGTGLDVNTGVVYGKEMGPVVLGVGTSFLLRGAYKPYVDYDLSYNPGDEWNATLGLDYGEENKWTGDITLTYYSADKVNGKQAFRSGVRLLVDFRHYRKMTLLGKSSRVVFYLLNRTKGKNAYALGGGLQSESLNSNGNQLELGVINALGVSQTLSANTQVAFLLYSNNAYKTGGAKIFRVGGGVPFRLSPNLTVDNSLIFSVGSLTVAQQSVSVTGIAIRVGLVYTF